MDVDYQIWNNNFLFNQLTYVTFKFVCSIVLLYWIVVICLDN
jgi:hypothetical protein